jgi:molybdopterin-guanine dinucleotide biosynthesis protein A
MISEPKTDMTGIILAGGNSIRMGQNKAFLPVDGVPIVRKIHTLLKELFNEVIIITNQKDLFKEFEPGIYSDLLPDKGALGGLYTGVFYSRFEYSFCVACDMPFLKRPLVQFLISNTKGEDAIIPRTQDGLQPLHAIYSKRCLDAMKRVIDQGKYKIIDFYDIIKAKIVEETEFLYLDPLRESFINVNTPEELRFIQRVRESQGA